ncbi:hypothetical protein MD484_g752, partial [Candolleomyces efflorescens]
MKNSRLLAEFREIDSYLTESDEDEDWDEDRPTLAQTQFDNSILKMARTLLQAARANPIEVTGEIPQVVLRLTRLDPTISEGPEADPRIAKTVDMLQEMGIIVQLGERVQEELVLPPSSEDKPSFAALVPSLRINLDLSVLIALISDLTHAPLPASIEEANKRFIPPKEYREWKQTRRKQTQKTLDHDAPDAGDPRELDEGLVSVEDLPHDLATHSRALTNQLLQEMSRSMIQEIKDRIEQRGTSGIPTSISSVEFWVTNEARDRCLRIVSKIGAVNEKRRAYALFSLDPSDPAQRIPLEQAEQLFWLNSRFDRTLPLFPLHFHSSSPLPPDSPVLEKRAARHPFFKALATTCQHILDQETMPHPRSVREKKFISQPTPFPSESSASGSPQGLIDFTGNAEIQRATVTKANPRLTAHTVESMLWGAELGWTTLTANRTSVKAILKEMDIARLIGKLDGLDIGADAVDETASAGDSDRVDPGVQEAAIWIVDPRSLAEQMCSQALYQ